MNDEQEKNLKDERRIEGGGEEERRIGRLEGEKERRGTVELETKYNVQENRESNESELE
jgi:hypothetical protein